MQEECHTIDYIGVSTYNIIIGRETKLYVSDKFFNMADIHKPTRISHSYLGIYYIQ